MIARAMLYQSNTSIRAIEAAHYLRQIHDLQTKASLRGTSIVNCKTGDFLKS